MDALWDKSKVMKMRLADVLEYIDGTGYFQERPVIERDSPIDGGVCLGAGSREAIVIDSEEYPRLGELYEKAKNKVRNMKYDGDTGKKFSHSDIYTGKEVFEEKAILDAVYSVVKEAMPIQENEAVLELLREYGIQNDGKISLDRFIEAGVGVCRHDAVACASLLEMFKRDGHINGKISVDRNATKLGGHAWCRYTSASDGIYILDIAYEYAGLIENGNWAYKRPTDINVGDKNVNN